MIASYPVSIDTATLPEGANDFLVGASDRPGNHRTSDGFRVLADHTPPPMVSGVRAEFDSESGNADVDWTDVADGALPDGNPGSGLSDYSYRFRRDSTSWSEWNTTRDSGFSVAGSQDGEHLLVQIRAYDAVGNGSATWEGDLVAVDPDNDASGPSDGPLQGEDEVDALGTSEAEYEGADNSFPPDVSATGAFGRSPFFGVTVTEPSASVQGTGVASVPAPKHCGRSSYDGDGAQDTFRIKFGRRGETKDGDVFYQFHLHYQVRLPFRENVAWTWLAGTRTLPNGAFDTSPYDDSRNRLLRDPVHWKPYYAHFLRLKVKPGSLMTYWGRWQYKAPVPVGPGARQIGGHYYGACIAWLNA